MAVDETPGWVPDACDLPTAQRPLRLAEFDRLFRDSVRESSRVNDTRLDLMLNSAAEATARDLAERETRCCSFFRFEFSSRGTDLVMHVNVPAAQIDVLNALSDRIAAAADTESTDH